MWDFMAFKMFIGLCINGQGLTAGSLWSLEGFQISWCPTQVTSYFKYLCRVLFVFRSLLICNFDLTMYFMIWSWEEITERVRKKINNAATVFIPFKLQSKSNFWRAFCCHSSYMYQRFVSTAHFPQWSGGNRLFCLLLPLLRSHKAKQVTNR